MTFPTPHVLTVRRVEAEKANAFGNATTSSTEHDWPVYFVAPGAMADLDSGTRDTSTIAYTVGAPKSEAMPTEYDQVLVDGEWLSVNGRPKDFTRGPWGFSPGVIVELEVVNG